MHGLARFSTAVLGIAVAGCGGGAGSSAPAPAHTPSPATVTVMFRIVVPTAASNKLRRVPAYVSPATESASITAAPFGGSAGTPVVVNCTSVCTGQIAAPVGSDTFTVGLYAGPNATGNLLSTGTLAQTIVANVANDVNLTFNGVVASIQLSLSPGTVTAGVPSVNGVTVNGLDASGNVIVGPGVYVSSTGTPIGITLSDSDQLGYPGRTTLSTTEVTQPTSGITLSYNGVGLNPFAETYINPIITAATTPTTSVPSVNATLTVDVATAKIYAANYANNSITVYPANSTGNIAPTQTIVGAMTGLNSPDGIAVDGSGNIYVANNAGNNVEVFAPAANGNVAPTSTISGDLSGIYEPVGLAVDSTGKIYVANAADVTVYAAGANGNVLPVATIYGGNTTISSLHGIAVDANANIYVAENYDTAGPYAAVFAAGSSGNVTPTATINTATNVYGIAVAPNGKVYTSVGLLLQVFAANPSGSITTPASQVTDDYLNTYGTYGLAIDGSGQVYVSQPFNTTTSVQVLPPNAGTGTEPIAGLLGTNTGLSVPNAIAVH